MEYGVLVGDERQQVRSYRNMVCLLVKNTNKGVHTMKDKLLEYGVLVGEERQQVRRVIQMLCAC